MASSITETSQMSVGLKKVGPSEQLKKRSDIHWARKLWHMVGVSTMALIYALAPEAVSKTLITVACLLFIPFDFVRMRWDRLNDLVLHVMRPIMRENEHHGVAGTSYLFLGVGITIWFFPKEIVLLSMLFLAFADPFASYFGIKYGKDKIFGHKSVQGSFAALTICSTLTAIFLYYQGLFVERLMILSLIGGLIGALAELIPIWKLDDNLSLPVLSAIALNVVFNVFGALTPM